MTGHVTTGRVVIIGAGIAALSAALDLAPRPVLVISPERLGSGASSAWAQGGVAAALGAGDSPADHAEDTILAGAGTVDTLVARFVAEAAPDRVRDLAALGAPFDRDAAGHFGLSREAAHRRARVARVQGDQSGRAIMRTLVSALHAAPSVQVLEGVAAEALLCEGGQVRGVWLCRADRPSGRVALRAPAVLMAAGGAAALYEVTTNPPRIRGQALGMAALAGALIADAEFVQFHPTAIATGEAPAPLATEALRGEGAVLVNARGERFMAGLHPEGDLAPRDIVARAVFAQTRAGLGPMLDTRAALGPAIVRNFPAVAAACARAGIDPVIAPIPVAAAAHYHMGGIATDMAGRSSLPGLWAAGEAASTGLHGANRLASNGLLEALVLSRAAARDIDNCLPAVRPEPEVALCFPPGGETAGNGPAIARLRRVMTTQVGVERDARSLRAALGEIAEIERDAGQDGGLRAMTAAATMIAAAALMREESRGAHCRTDFPGADPAQARASRLTLAQALLLRESIAREPV